MTHIFTVTYKWRYLLCHFIGFSSYTYYLSSCGVLNILPCYLCPGIQVTGSVSLYFWAFYVQTTLWPFSYWSILVFFIFLLRISVPQHSVSGNRSTFIIKVYYHHGYIGNLNNVFMIIVVMWCHQWVQQRIGMRWPQCPPTLGWNTKTFESTVSPEIYTSERHMAWL